jgi:hypothetical protein
VILSAPSTVNLTAENAEDAEASANGGREEEERPEAAY